MTTDKKSPEAVFTFVGFPTRFEAMSVPIHGDEEAELAITAAREVANCCRDIEDEFAKAILNAL